MNQALAPDDIGTIIEALKYYRMHIENYDRYPSYEFKQQQLARVDSAMRSIKSEE